MKSMVDSLREHWPEYLMEAAGLGLFMISAGVFTTLLEYPHSPVHQAIASPLVRRGLIGLAMGLTAVAIIYSPWGQQSGAHLNPAVTLTFFGLGKIAFWDALFYVSAQFLGGLAGVLLTLAVLGEKFSSPPVSYVATVPGMAGVAAAFLGEVLITFCLMSMVLITTNTPRLSRFTGMFAGLFVAFYITVEAPYSGMSMNPARTFASALPSGNLMALWVYFTAPILGMALAAVVYQKASRRHEVICAKLNHHTHRRCIFLRCNYMTQMADRPVEAKVNSPHNIAAMKG
jgi:aquaporin Z